MEPGTVDVVLVEKILGDIKSNVNELRQATDITWEIYRTDKRSRRFVEARNESFEKHLHFVIPAEAGIQKVLKGSAAADFRSVLACDIGTCRKYGYIKSLLHKKRHPIPENDIWIAALSMEHDLALVSCDEHFKMINELKRVAW